MIPRPNLSFAKFSSKNSENLNALMRELMKEEELLARAEETQNLTEENVRNLKTLNLNTPEWKIHPGNAPNERIPQNLLPSANANKTRRARRRKSHRRKTARR